MRSSPQQEEHEVISPADSDEAGSGKAASGKAGTSSLSMCPCVAGLHEDTHAQIRPGCQRQES